MKIPLIQLTRIVIALFAIGASPAGMAAAKPNVLFIITDQHTLSGMSCAGNKWVKTPALDSLASRGARFEKSYCTFPLCSPSRASQVTSLMPHQMGITSNKNKPTIPSSVATLGDMFRAAGYETQWAGKWHLPAAFPGYMSAAKASIPGFDVLRLEGAPPRTRTDTAPGLGGDPATVDAAVKFLQQSHSRPFFLTVSILNPHDICEYPTKPEHFPKPEAGVELPPLPANFDAITDEPSVIARIRERQYGPGSPTASWGEKEWRTYIWVYHRLVETADGLIGQVLDALEKSGQADNTIVVYSSDHGEMTAAHKLRTKLFLYEEAVAVPLIVCPPGKSGKSVLDSTHLVSGLDLFPTLCDYAGIKVADHAKILGKSLRPLIEQKPGAWRKYVVSEMGGTNSSRMVRSDRYKYVVYARGDKREQLFDLDKDPAETKNLASQASLKTVLEEHRDYLNEWNKRTDDPFPNEAARDAQQSKEADE
jgi:arylsulfatase A-like enzyme